MAREPTYPEDASVGGRASRTPPTPPEPPVPASGEATKGATDSRRTKHIVAGAAIGIGSAAIVAALLYANRSRRNS